MGSKVFYHKLGLWAQRLILLTWFIMMGIVLSYSYPFFSSMHSITKISKSYFEVSFDKTKGVNYVMVNQRPKDWVELKDISKRLQGAIISSEDGKFYLHKGYDVEELTDAIDKGLIKKRKKKKLRGASTITQQLIKNLYLQNDRSFWRKTKEMALTLWMEDHVDKKKILETYLNVIEYGEGLYGIGEASKYYFKKVPSKLTARESAFLAMLLPSPKKYAVSYKRKTLTAFAERSVHSILFKMLQGGYIGVNEYSNNINTHFSWERYEQASFTSDDIGNL